MRLSIDEALAVAVEYLRPPPNDPLSVWLEDHVRLPHGLAVDQHRRGAGASPTRMPALPPTPNNS
jgi:hypothetical protein